MKNILSSVIIVCFGLMFFNCEDVFEENISSDVMTVIFPKNGEVLTGNSVSFNWKTLEGADEYRIQILKSDSEEVVIDSLFSSSSLTLPLNSGVYDWRIRGENFAYQTAYSFPEQFSIESNDDLSTQNVFLNSPSENFYTKNNTIILNWSELDVATSYVLQITKTVGSNSSIILQEVDIVTNGYALDNTVLSEDAVYNWSVRGVNENSQTGFSTRTLFLDTTAPNIPIPTAPNDNETSATTVDFSWTQSTDSGAVQSPLSSVLEIASDANYNTLIQSYQLTDDTQQHNFTDTGQYYWRVKTTDEAGNESDYSTSRTITIE